jgi:hypothetical protein
MDLQNMQLVDVTGFVWIYCLQLQGSYDAETYPV